MQLPILAWIPSLSRQKVENLQNLQEMQQKQTEMQKCQVNSVVHLFFFFFSLSLILLRYHFLRLKKDVLLRYQLVVDLSLCQKVAGRLISLLTILEKFQERTVLVVSHDPPFSCPFSTFLLHFLCSFLVNRI